MHLFFRRLRLALPLVAAVLGFGAAGPAAAQATKIKVVVAPTAFEAVYIARDQGIFAKHKLDVEIIPGGPPDAMIPLLLNGQVHYGMSSGPAAGGHVWACAPQKNWRHYWMILSAGANECDVRPADFSP